MSESLVAIVTGGAQGLGADICAELLKKGYRVCVSDINEDTGKRFTKEQQKKYGIENVDFTACDVTKECDFKKLFDFTVKRFGKINLVVNNAGIVLEQNARKTIDVNLMGPIIGCQLAFQYMGKTNGGKGGMVINTASIMGFLPYRALPAYVASKHGVIGLTRSYGVPYHFERDGVLVTAICPTFTKTALVQNLRTNTLVAGFDPYEENEVISPELVIEGISKLLEDRINGSTLLVTTKGFTYVGYPEEFKEIAIQ